MITFGTDRPMAVRAPDDVVVAATAHDHATEHGVGTWTTVCTVVGAWIVDEPLESVIAKLRAARCLAVVETEIARIQRERDEERAGRGMSKGLRQVLEEATQRERERQRREKAGGEA